MPDPLSSSVPPRYLSRIQAAAYVGVSATTFDAEVAAGHWPAGRRRGARAHRVTWDVRLLDLYADRASGLDATTASSADAQAQQHDAEAIALERSSYAAPPHRSQNRRSQAA
jgi:hypothetical protein